MYAKYYARIIGIFFCLVVITLVTDYAKFGFRAETIHKLLHVTFGVIVLRYAWNSPAWWRPFALTNGAFFSLVAFVGVLFPNFGGLDAFNRTDTVLHAIVGISGFAAGIFPHNKKKWV